MARVDTLLFLLTVASEISPLLAGFSLAFSQKTADAKSDNSDSRAVDGNLNTNWGSASCTASSGLDPWWRVDLGRDYYVSVVQVLNRGDCCGERLTNFEIRVGSSLENDGNTNSQCGGLHSVPQGQSVAFPCSPPLMGRYVNIRIPGPNKHLTLCEVLVNPPVSTNLARGKTATQSSKDAFAKFAVDGIYQTTWIKGYCTHTYMESNPWWRVDLAQVQPVSEIYLVNRGDCCANRLWNVEVRVGNSADNGGVSNKRCGGLFSVPRGQAMSVFCEPRVNGRYVYVRRPGITGYLTLCEAAVFSESRPLIINSNPVDMKAVEGEPIKLKCRAPSYPTPQITWMKNGVVLPQTGQKIIKMALKSDSGTYKCVVSSIHGKDVHIFNLTVEAKCKSCTNLEVLSDPTRHVNASSTMLRDAGIDQNKWYRFEGLKGMPSQIPRVWVPEDRCGTEGPGWMKGELPTFRDGIVLRTVCFHLDGNICYVSTKILVRKCPSGFYSYKLKPIYFHGRYCSVDQEQGEDDVPTLNEAKVFTLIAQGAALYNHVTHDESGVPDVMACISCCTMVPGCLSFNYDFSSLQCQLNNATASQFPENLHKKDDSNDHYENIGIKHFIVP